MSLGIFQSAEPNPGCPMGWGPCGRKDSEGWGWPLAHLRWTLLLCP